MLLVGEDLKVDLSVVNYVKVVEEALYLVVVGAAVTILFAVVFIIIPWDKAVAVISEIAKDIEAMRKFAEAL